MTGRYFLVRIGTWKFENWHLYRYVQTGNSKYRWMKWQRVI